MQKREIGIFSGSFNPIHAGHLILANYIREFTYIDEVWFVVSPHNPLKEVADLLDDDIRLEMTQKALDKFSHLVVSDVEFHMPRPSYTIDTLTKLTDIHRDKNFTLIIGGDNWTKFDKWKDYERIIDQYRILIYPRLGERINIPDKFHKSVHEVNAPIMELSSTFIRNSIREGKNMRAFVPSVVYDFIEKNGLYR
ncbi:MAG: nicotinate (nicotinamide) nucleotide adenylyltransferase [Proteiniphilum sp.]|nr:nicotinate (nicotinamide) nucleotide adenylyltransferase [Proteiniphilum sp.]MDD4416499.1 nicotinate (nicotinamide) nucleotide adenylyltransferase [Proteiniphilum sp.]